MAAYSEEDDSAAPTTNSVGEAAVLEAPAVVVAPVELPLLPPLLLPLSVLRVGYLLLVLLLLLPVLLVVLPPEKCSTLPRIQRIMGQRVHMAVETYHWVTHLSS